MVQSSFRLQTSDLSQPSAISHQPSRVPVHLQSVAALANQLLRSGTSIGATIEEFNSDNTYRLNLEETKAKIADLQYIKNELAGIPNIV